MSQDNLEKFLFENRISDEQWSESGVKWDDLELIGEDYENEIPHLEATAALLANIVQRFGSVHSVRWRVKNKDHLLAKIVRKRAEGNERYKNISVENYGEIITDLIGLRAIHLFKSDFLMINDSILNLFSLNEPPVVYIRQGDDAQFSQQCSNIGFLVKEHPKGYRSIHYVIATQPLKKRIFVELQVRTIFEEGWSEIDHIVRYPNYSDDAQLAYLLTIFNRMSGSADEMGGFVKVLANELNETKNRLENVVRERDQSLAKAEAALEQLEAVKGGPTGSDQIKELKKELNKLKAVPAAPKSGTSATSIVNLLSLFGMSQETANSVRSSIKAIEDMSSAKAALKAMEDVSSTKAALKAMEDVSSAKAALKAMEDVSSTKAALKAMEDVSSTKAALKAMEDMSSTKAALKVMEDMSSTNAALKASKDQGGVS